MTESGYRTIATHIRGRVYPIGRSGPRQMSGGWTLPGYFLFGMEVINTNTGKVLRSDNCSNYQRIVEECHSAVAGARAAWFWEFKQKELR